MAATRKYGPDGNLESANSFGRQHFLSSDDRNGSTTSATGVGRRLSSFQAMQVVQKGDGTEIDAELEALEAQVAALKKPWYEVSFNDPRYFTWLLVGFASMGGLLSGIDQSLISGANLSLPTDLHFTAQQSSLVSSGVPLGAVGGALMLGPLNELVGRRMAIIWSLVLYTIGAGLEAGAINFGMMMAGRLILGLGVGLEGGTVPVYVAESISRKYRGNLVSLYQFMIALGEVLGYAVAAMFETVDGNWRYMLGSSLVFSTVMFVGMIFMPESPRFLMHKDKMAESYHVWKRIRGTDVESREEFFIMKHSVEEEREARHSSPTGRKRFVWLDFFTNPRARRSIIYANIMVFLGQFTGINAIQYYMATLMNQIGFSKTQSVYMSLVGGGSLLLGTIPAIFFMERFGRRFWANAMLPGFFIGLILIGGSYQINSKSNPGGAEGLYIAGLIIYEGFFGCYSCLTWVIPSEVYPTYLRSYGMESSDVNLFLCSFLVTYFFTQMQNAFTRTGLSLGFYGGIAVLGWFYQILFMPETKNKTLEEIDLLFSQPTGELVKQNWASTKRVAKDLVRGRWGSLFREGEESVVPVQHGDLNDDKPANIGKEV